MRKLLLGILCVTSCAVLLLLFGVMVYTQMAGITHGAAIAWEFPLEVSGTPLRVLQLTEYKGPFLEEPGSKKVVHTTVLVLENIGGMYISRGAVVVQKGEQNLVFELRDIPPGAKVLVLEKDAQLLSTNLELLCYGWVKEEYPEQNHWIRWNRSGGRIAVTNTSDHVLDVLELCWKRSGEAGDIYIGGVSFQTILRDVRPGETRLVDLPDGWHEQAKIVKTLVYEE